MSHFDRSAFKRFARQHMAFMSKRTDLPGQRIFLPLKLRSEGERVDAVAGVEPGHCEDERLRKDRVGWAW